MKQWIFIITAALLTTACASDLPHMRKDIQGRWRGGAADDPSLPLVTLIAGHDGTLVMYTGYEAADRVEGTWRKQGGAYVLTVPQGDGMGDMVWQAEFDEMKGKLNLGNAVYEMERINM